MDPVNSLAKILDADLEELTELHLRRADRATALGFYVSALRHFLEGNIAYLNKTLERLGETNFPEKDLLARLVRARVAVHYEKVGDDTITALEAALPSAGAWRAEVIFVIALCHEARNELKLMSRRYQEAAAALEEAGARKKAVRALLNHVVAESNIHKDRKFLRDYEFVYRQAKKAKVFSAAAVALMNISYEYRELGALTLSLSHVNRALALLERQKHGRSYYLALAHRAHVLHNLGRVAEARIDFEQLSAAEFPDIERARATLEALFNGTAPPAQAPSESWADRAKTLHQPPEKLGALEEKLVRYLAEAPREKGDLVTHLYGDTLKWEVLENRFKNTLTRLKKKYPGLVTWDNGKYRLSEELFRLWQKRSS